MMSIQGSFETEVNEMPVDSLETKTPSTTSTPSWHHEINAEKSLNFPCYKEFGCKLSFDSQKGLSLHQNRCKAVDKKLLTKR